MASSNGLDQMRALGSINSAGNSAGSGGGGMVPAAMQLAQRGGLGGGGYPAMLQQQYLQQTLPWLLRVQVRAPGGNPALPLPSLALPLP